MTNLRILILAPWLTRRPRHGGALRGAAVVQAYRDAGHNVHCAGFYNAAEAAPDDVWPEDLPVQPGVSQFWQAMPDDDKRSEMAYWGAVAAAEDSFATFVVTVGAARPDLLQFEELAFWPACVASAPKATWTALPWHTRPTTS